MASVNKVVLLGRLGRDPETRYASDGGTPICHLAVATSRRYKDRDGNRGEETEWHNVVLFGKTAEIAQQYLQKGSEVYIEGRLRTRSYEKDGVKRYSTEIIGESMQMGARPTDVSAKPAQKPEPTSTASQYAAASGRAAPASQVPDEEVPF
jgi:single-strand DNA-binding protein